MNKYTVVKKVAQAITITVTVVILLYVFFRLMPGNPAELIIAAVANKGKLSPAKLQDLLKVLGLQYGKWSFSGFIIYLRDMFMFRFGTSYNYRNDEAVIDVIRQALPYTLLLFGLAAVLSFIIGLPSGILTMFARGKKKEGAILGTSIILNSIPFFVLAIFLYVYIIGDFGVFPPSATAMNPKDLYDPTLYHLERLFYYMALPLITLTAIEAMGHLITMRAAMVSVMGEDYITTAKATGLSSRKIMFHNAARNAMIPVSTRMALEFAVLAGGAVIVEIIFGWPGMGHILFNATENEDYPLAEAGLYILALMTIIAYSLTDFIHAWLDPRLR
ncbi:MAG: ABC transporter permease [Candidatus Thermoplasmatota archaeon]|nr:ABC transporter permease [Candidatus Thermoplasmatota archaeon]